MAEEADFLFIVYLVAGFALDGWSFPISLIKLTFVIEDHVRALKNFIKFFLEVPSSVEVLGNFRRLHFFLALMSHTTFPAILDFSTKILCPFWAFFY